LLFIVPKPGRAVAKEEVLALLPAFDERGDEVLALVQPAARVSGLSALARS
jgi:hypothetical protein